MARNSNQILGPKAKALLVGAFVALVFGLIILGIAFEKVPEGHQGVEKEWDAVSGNTLDSGAHWKVPWMQEIQHVETRPRTYTMTNEKGEGKKKDADAVMVKTANGSSVNVSVTVRYRINSEQADVFVEEWNNEQQMEKRLIRPTVKTNLQDEGSSLQTTGPGSIYTNEGREALRQTTKVALESEVDNQPIVIEAVQIRDIGLPKKIDQTLDQKEQAKQQVEVEQEKVKQEEAKKEQRIVQAQAEAEEVRISAEADANATRIRGEALDEHPIVLEQQYIDALRNGETIYVGEEGVALTRETDRQENDEGGN